MDSEKWKFEERFLGKVRSGEAIASEKSKWSKKKILAFLAGGVAIVIIAVVIVVAIIGQGPTETPSLVGNWECDEGLYISVSEGGLMTAFNEDNEVVNTWGSMSFRVEFSEYTVNVVTFHNLFENTPSLLCYRDFEEEIFEDEEFVEDAE